PMVDAYKAVVAASKTTGEGTDEENERGSVLGFVVNKDDESEAVYGANLTFTDAETEEYYWAWTDEEGHFEMALPEGDYYLDVTARDYQDYSWKDGEETIHVDAEGVLYLDWIKMTKGSGGSGKKKKLPDGVSWVTEPEIEVDDILVGDMYSEYSSSDTPRSAPYVYYIQDGKYGLIDYYGTVQVEPEYDGFDGKSYSYDRFIAVYNKKTGETVYSLRGNGKKGVWYTETTDEVYGSFFIGEVNLSGYYKDPDDGKLYNYNNYQDSASPVNNVGNKNLYIAQETVVDPKKLELSDYDCIADGKGFFVCDAEGNELTKHYKYFYANSLGTDSAILNEEQPFCALSDDGETWELFSYKGDFLPYSFEAFECNSFGSVWAPGYSDDTNEFNGPFPFCATDGYIAAKIDGECGYIDTDGNVVVEFGIFEDIRPVHNGMAWVKYDGKWGVISFD
ncbi:MAG: WG repeat-containing protein, partial [Ruminococcus sp.]|nr:WG repeat-containing protein [Ruminococcus sp.]